MASLKYAIYSGKTKERISRFFTSLTEAQAKFQELKEELDCGVEIRIS